MSDKYPAVAVAAKVTPRVKEIIRAYVQNQEYMSESDYIRTAIREKIKRDEEK